MENESNQELLSWEECRKRIIELGKFEFYDDNFHSRRHNYVKNKTVFPFVLQNLMCLTGSFPDNISYQERIYCILHNIKEYKFHYCPTCNKILNFLSVSVGYKTYCSCTCRNLSPLYQEYVSNILLERIGYTNASKDPKIQELKKKNYKEKTGYDHWTNDPKTIDKMQETYFERTGFLSPAQNPDTWVKYRQTSLANWGTSTPMQNEKVKEKSRSTYRDKTGYNYSFQNPEARNKGKETYYIQTGYYHNMQNPEHKESRVSSHRERTGYDYPLQIPENKVKWQESYFNKTGYKTPFNNPEIILKSQTTYKSRTGYKSPFNNPIISKMGNIAKAKLGISNYSKISQDLFNCIYTGLTEELKQECYYATCNFDSKHHREFNKEDTENNTVYFYDFTLSHVRFIIEFDGDYWHSKSEAKERDAQKQKFIENLGFKVIRIKELDYIENKQNIVKYCLQEIFNYTNSKG